tara:strand:+ start:902 stop:1921 length:1020 start_codon:yes stop_codon:yes gene_type:complete
MSILVTGCCGFIGYHLSKKLLEEDKNVIGIDNLNDYYNPKLKKDRLKELQKSQKEYKSKLIFYECHLEDKRFLKEIFQSEQITCVINLAAQAGVRYSLTNPQSYIDSNIQGFLNILENCKSIKIKNLIYASSSSVYGGNKVIPFSESHGVDHPISIYAATKRTNELMAHTYSYLYKIPSTGLRFFTVYGPWGRPDMAMYKFTESILKSEPIQIFNYGKMMRDFTYIDDIVKSIIKLINKPASINKEFNFNRPDPSTSFCPHRIFNIGNSNPVNLIEYIEEIENCLNKKAIKEFLPLQDGDVPDTFSDCKRLEEWIGFKPKTSIKVGVKKFVSWYKNYAH